MKQRMIGRITATVGIGIAMFVGYQINRIEIPEGLNDNAAFYRTSTVIFSITIKMAKFGAFLKIDNEISLFRRILGFLSDRFGPDNSASEHVKIEYRVINGITTKIYSPKNDINSSGGKPVLIYYHGGAYVIGDLSTYDLYLSEFVKKLNMNVVSVRYRKAPEYAFPIPTDDCFSVTKYIIENVEEFNADIEKIVLAGDSAGGNAVAVITQRLLKEKLPQPKLQILIYPWVQLLNFMLPSTLQFGKTGIFSELLSTAKVISWYLGITEVSSELDMAINTNQQISLLEDFELRERIKSYYDLSNIPTEYRQGTFYETHEQVLQRMYPERLDENHVMRRDAKVKNDFRKLSDARVSPLLADDEKLIGLPRAYMIIMENDSLKDEGFLYAARLKKVGVPVEVKFYKHGFHGIAPMIDTATGYQIARDMKDEVIEFLRNYL